MSQNSTKKDPLDRQGRIPEENVANTLKGEGGRIPKSAGGLE